MISCGVTFVAMNSPVTDIILVISLPDSSGWCDPEQD
jgi:hypothetical protein